MASERRPQPAGFAVSAAISAAIRASAPPPADSLEAADVSAAADDRRVVDDLDVADVAGRSLGAAVQLAVGDQPGADARPDLHEDDIGVAGGDAGPPLAERHDVDVVVDPDRRAVALRRSARGSGSRPSRA